MIIDIVNYLIKWFINLNVLGVDYLNFDGGWGWFNFVFGVLFFEKEESFGNEVGVDLVWVWIYF